MRALSFNHSTFIIIYHFVFLVECRMTPPGAKESNFRRKIGEGMIASHSSHCSLIKSRLLSHTPELKDYFYGPNYYYYVTSPEWPPGTHWQRKITKEANIRRRYATGRHSFHCSLIKLSATVASASVFHAFAFLCAPLCALCVPSFQSERDREKHPVFVKDFFQVPLYVI